MAKLHYWHVEVNVRPQLKQSPETEFVMFDNNSIAGEHHTCLKMLNFS